MTIGQATLLVVDDEPVIRMTFAVVLRQHGAIVHTAGDGVEALGILEREPIDAMLTDSRMPMMDGLALLRTLAVRRMSIPSLLFVSVVDPENEEEMRRLGVLEIVTKPLHPEKLARLLTKVLKDLPPTQKRPLAPLAA